MPEGGCLCGAVRYRVSAFDGPVLACHCGQCRKQSGHFAAAAPVRREDLHLDGSLTWYESSKSARRGFCAVCGSTLFWQESDDAIWVLAGTVDPPTGLRLSAHIYYADKGDYYRAAGGAPCFAKLTDGAEVAP